MVRKLPAADFRARRMVLEPKDFFPGDDVPEPAPTDIVGRMVWHGIMDLADDVAIRTTSHQGSRVELLYELWGAWVEVTPYECMLENAMSDCADDFKASILSLLHGFYRQAVGTLRSAIEIMVFACLCELTDDRKGWRAWEAGKDEINFRQSRHKLQKTSAVQVLEGRARAATGRTIFADKNGPDPGGWATSLHSYLSNFIHAHGNSSNGRIWRSNGPVYSAEGMRLGYHSYLETYALLLLLAKIAHPSLIMPRGADMLFSYDSRRQYLRKLDRKLCGFIKRDVFPASIR